MRGRKTTEESKQIIKLVKKGKSYSEMKKLGYNCQTIIYYIRKIRNPEYFEKITTYIKAKNKTRYWNAKNSI